MIKEINHRKKEKLNPVIAEIKVFSPKHGDLLKGRDIFEILKIYEECRVAGISYITAEQFKGDFKTLKEICAETHLPVLRKDFILRKEEIERSAEIEVSTVLLITRYLGEKLPEFVDFSLEHGLETLVEVHSIDEIKIANDSNTKMIGINNRDISQLERDDGNVSLTEDLHRFIKKGVIKISESGIRNVEDLKRAMNCVDAVLVGTAFMMAENIEEIVKSFVGVV